MFQQHADIIQGPAGKRVSLRLHFFPNEVQGRVNFARMLLHTLCHSIAMEQLSGTQRAFAVKSFYKKNDNLEAARHEFRQHSNLRRHDLIPSANVIKIWVSNFKETGSVLKKKKPPGGR
jgi:hypothetical protein